MNPMGACTPGVQFSSWDFFHLGVPSSSFSTEFKAESLDGPRNHLLRSPADLEDDAVGPLYAQATGVPPSHLRKEYASTEMKATAWRAQNRLSISE